MTAPAQLARYALSGAGGLAVSLGVTALLREGAGLSAQLSFAVALAVVFAYHFAANAFFVFRSGASAATFLRYAGVALAFRGLEFLLFRGVAEFTSLYVVGVLVALGVSNAVKFLAYRHAVFTGADGEGS